MGMLPTQQELVTTDELFSRVNVDDYERP